MYFFTFVLTVKIIFVCFKLCLMLLNGIRAHPYATWLDEICRLALSPPDSCVAFVLAFMNNKIKTKL